VKPVSWKKRLLSYGRIVISVILIVWLVQMINGSQLLQALSGANVWFIALMVLVCNADRVLMAYKWNLLLKAKGLRLPLISAVSAYYKSTFWGSLFLPTVGADAVRIFEVSKQTGRVEDLVSSVVLERLFGLISVALVGLVSLSLFVVYIDSNEWLNLVWLAIGVVLAGLILWVSFSKIALGRLFAWTNRWRGLGKIDRIWASYQEYANHRRVLGTFLGWSVLEQMVSVINWYLVARALHVEIPFVTFLMFVPIIVLAVRMPISFDGFGVREVLAVYFFGLVGVAQSQAFLVAFVTAIIARIATAPLTLYFFLLHRDNAPPAEVNSDLSRA
jgi:glycosyltransferase 2 family protein